MIRNEHRMYTYDEIKLSEYKRMVFRLLLWYRETLKKDPDRFQEKEIIERTRRKINKADREVSSISGLSSEQLKRKWKNN